MPRTYTANNARRFSQQDIVAAMQAVETGTSSMRKVARRFHMSEAHLRKNIKHKKNLEMTPRRTVGNPLNLPEDSEKELAVLLTIKSKWGFASTREEVCELVQDYVKINITKETPLAEHLRKYCRFKNCKPGSDWLTNFMKRSALSTKKPSGLEKARQCAASDPTIIYGFYDLLVREMERLGIMNRPECIWNTDESNCNMDPVQTKVVAPKGKKASRVTASSGRENITVMAAVSAAGERRPPFIVFKGTYKMASWEFTRPYPGTEIGTSDNGWMTSTLFQRWFGNFCAEVTQRPLLLIYDGHATHINSTIITKARTEGISILKLPSHTTDRLQPLDVSCFRPLKVKWDKAISAWQKNNRCYKPSKGIFIDLLGSIWADVFTEQNIKAGFVKTGIYPFNKAAYPESAFNPHLLTIYKAVAEQENRPTVSKPQTPQKSVGVTIHNACTTSSPSPSSIASPPARVRAPSFNTNIMTSTPSTSFSVPSSSNQDHVLSPTSTSYPQQSFEQILADSFHRQSTSNVKPKPTRRRLIQTSEIITTEEFQKLVAEMEEATTKPKEKRGRPKVIQTRESSSDSSASEMSDDSLGRETNIIFNERKYDGIKKNIKVNDWCAVDYGNVAYVGRIVTINSSNIDITFLSRYPNDEYRFPKKVDNDKVTVDRIFVGPIPLSGTVPYTIHGVQSAFKDYVAFRKRKGEMKE